MNAMQAAYYADQMEYCETPIVSNQRIAQETYRLRIATPPIARQIVPGQFVMIRMSALDDPLIGRALAVYDVGFDQLGNAHTIDLVYIRKGKLTRRLVASPPGTLVSLWGPLGNGFPTTPCETLVMVAGGIGHTPFLALAKEALGQQNFGKRNRSSRWAQKVHLIYGARTAGLLAGVDDFRATGIDVQLCTDDGSDGQQGRVTDLLDPMLATLDRKTTRVVCCGPEIMMEKTATVAADHQVACEVSLETPMACGIGICFSCVAKVQQADGSWDYKRTCVEGPVFPAEKICWDRGQPTQVI